MRSCRRVYALLLAVILPAADVVVVQAIESAGLSFDTLEGAGWSVHSAEVRLNWLDDGHAALQMRAATAVLPEPFGTVSDVTVTCPAADIHAAGVHCKQGLIRVTSAKFGQQSMRAEFDYLAASGRVSFALAGIRYAGGRLTASGVFETPAWNLGLAGRGLHVDAIIGELSSAGVVSIPLDGSGQLDVDARLQGTAAQVTTGKLTARLDTTSFSDEAGRLAGENLAVQLDASLTLAGDHWQITADVQGEQGQVYVEPVFLDLDERPVRATAQLDWQPGRGQLAIRSLDYRQTGALTVHLSGSVYPDRPVPIESLEVDVQEGRFPALYDTYLQPWLNETMLADLETSGRMEMQLSLRSGMPESLQLTLHDVRVDDREARFGLAGLAGRIAWGRDGDPRLQDLQWDNGHLFRVPLGAATIAMASEASQFSLREPARIAVLDGELQIDTAGLDYADDGVRRWYVDAILTPVSMRDLTRSLGWPEFSGKLSGVIPDVRYQDGSLEVGGMLLVRVFDGAITLGNLRLAEPFGIVPRLWLDARVKNIDLETLTETFSFGRIEGRLGGKIDGLYMESWRPVAFDAVFATPAGDTSRHRISQKAVDNISSIGGGGVGGALSRSFMRFLEDFPYDRLGIRCQLENGTCDMGGVQAAPNGYYIVKGRLLPPRLDVIGYADRVDWDSLVAQIVAVTQRQGAVMQ